MIWYFHSFENFDRKCTLENHQPEEIKNMFNITFLMHFQIKITVKIMNFALPIFEQMQKRYEKKNGIRSRVESEKENIIEHDAKDKIEGFLAEEIYSFAQETYSSKTQLLMESLDELIDLDWDDFQTYLDDPKLYCLKRYARQIENDYFEMTNAKYFKRAKVHWEAMRAGIKNAINVATQQKQCKEETGQKDTKNVIKDWLEMFVEFENIIGFSPFHFSYLEELIGTEKIDTDRAV